VQEVEGELIPTTTNLGSNQYGPYGQMRYTVHCVNIAQIGSFLDFWLGLGGGGGGGSISGTAGGTASYSGTSFPASPPVGSLQKFVQTFSSVTSINVVHFLNTSSVQVQCYAATSPVILVSPEVVQIIDANTVYLEFGAAFSGEVVIVG
jgi:hypothetical protein